MFNNRCTLLNVDCVHMIVDIWKKMAASTIGQDESQNKQAETSRRHEYWGGGGGGGGGGVVIF